MALVASAELDRSLSGDDVRFLVQKKLAPAGILTVGGDAVATEPPGRTAPHSPAPDSRLLALRFRRAVASPEAMGAWTQRFTPLFRPPVVAVILAAVLALDLWVFGVVGVGGTLEDVVRTPALMAFVIATIALSGIFHEFGHAAGCAASGGRPGAAGIGVYLCWPVLYTNVTDAYRLDRRGRLRTDLGGMYFNAVFILVLGGAHVLTRWEPLLALIAIQHVLVLQQLTPWLRLDGYYIVSDLTGVPDILSRVRPALSSLVPGRPTHPDVLALRPRARRILYGYVVSFVVFMVILVVPTVVVLPRALAASWDAAGPHARAVAAAAGRWDTVMVIVEAVQVAVLLLPLIGLALTFGTVAAHRLNRRHRPGPSRMPVRSWLDASDLAIVDGAELPGGGAVDYFGFGPEGEVVLFGTAAGRSPQAVASRLLAAAAELRAFSADKLDRLLLDGPPFAEVVAGAARRTGRRWDEERFRSAVDDALARGDFHLLVLRGGRLGTTLRVYPVGPRREIVTNSKNAANRHECHKVVQ
jgi:putative peptide zinc metalloprotease protein